MSVDGPRGGLLVLVSGGTATMSGVGGLAVSADGVGVLQAVAERFADEHGTRVGVELDPPMRDSAEMTPDDWDRWRRRIGVALADGVGVVLVHGTDTMAYTAAALAYAHADANGPVVLTGSQRAATAAGSDAAGNLRHALEIAATGTPGVVVAFAGRVLAAATVWKRSTTDVDAFDGLAGRSTRSRAVVPSFQGYDASRVVEIATVTLGRWHDQLDWAHRPDGVVLRVLGSGTAPADPRAHARLEALRRDGVPVLAVSQIPGALVDLSRYEAGRGLVEAGVVSCGAITAEAAYAKLHYLLGSPGARERLRSLVTTDLVGEARSAR
ncbi:L-asparaginase [Mumia flava]|uniref:L-asparaginase n=1 Tax=Mumia flava TaxID=1348852 RepID=A0A2M9B620_9ACTN|nr:asparaginase domain-containing protein [Mumia flava]PJJ53389.1 L-asparaginase [Mumia flava]